MAFCANCGNELREGAIYCPKCGTAVGNSNRSNGTSLKNYVKWIGVFALFAALCVGGYFGYSALSSDSPSKVTEKALSCLKNNDFSGYVDYCYLEGGEAQKNLTLLFSEKLKKYFEEKGGIKDYTINSESIDGDMATVNYTIHFGNGESESEDLQLKKLDGKWLLIKAEK